MPQTNIYSGAFAIKQTGAYIKGQNTRPCPGTYKNGKGNLDIKDGNIVRVSDGRVMMTLGELSTEVMYSLTQQRAYYGGKHLPDKSNAYSFGCSFAEVEVDIPLCKVKSIGFDKRTRLRKAYKSQLAEGQVHGE